MKLSKKKAKELSLKKWKYIVGNNGSEDGLTAAIPEIKDFSANCGYCEKYECYECPLFIDDKTCTSYGHLYCIWVQNQTTENAQAVLDLILKS